MIKKLASVLLVALMAFGIAACGEKDSGKTQQGQVHSNPQVLAEEGTYPIIKDEYKGQIDLKIMGANHAAINPDWSQNKFFQRMEGLTGVHFNFEVYGDDMYNEKKSLSLSTGNNLPDIFFKASLNNYDEVTYGGKSLIALNDLIDNYAPHIKAILEENPTVRKSITTTDGNIYSLPCVYLNQPNGTMNTMRGFMWINQTWLEELSLEMPKTPEEFLTVMRAFKQQKCKAQGAYPLCLAGIDDLLCLFNFFGLDLTQYWVQGEGKGSELTFGPTTQAFYDAVEFMRTLYSEGLMNPNWASFTSTQMGAQGPQGDYYGCFRTAAPQYVVGYTKMYDYTTLDPISPTGTDGFWGATLPVQRGCFAITSACEYPEVAIRWIDTIYNLDEPYSLWAIIGQEGEEWKWNDEEHTSWESTVSDADYSRVMATTIIQTGDGMPYAVDESFWAKQKTATDTYTRPLRDKQMVQSRIGFPYVYFNSADLREIGDLATDINSYINRFIAQALSEKDYLEKQWETFKEFRRLSLDRYLEILQARYDDFYA